MLFPISLGNVLCRRDQPNRRKIQVSAIRGKQIDVIKYRMLLKLSTLSPPDRRISAQNHSHREGTLNASTAKSPKVRNTPIGRICFFNTVRLSCSKTTRPKPIIRIIPPLERVCRLLNAMSGVSGKPSEEEGAECRELRLWVTFKVNP